MGEIQKIGREEVSTRDLYLLELGAPEDLSESIELPVEYFTCLIAWDSDDASVETISRLARTLLDAGCVYFCCWGRGCERLHDIVDEEFVSTWDPTDESHVMTTWHANDPIDEALWYFLFNTCPDDEYWDGCRAGLAIVVGDEPTWSGRVRFAMTEPRRFNEEVLAEEAGDES